MIDLTSLFIRRLAARPIAGKGVFLHQLSAAVADAEAAGDTETAEALKLHAKRLQLNLSTAYGDGVLSNSIAEFKDLRAFDPGRIKALWNGLEPVATHSAGRVCIFDCGERGTATVTSAGILFTGSLAMEPCAALLTAQHDKEAWNGRGIAFGSPEFLFNVAIADSMVGNQKPDFKIAPSQIDRANVIARAWTPIFDKLMQSATRASKRPSPPGACATIISAAAPA